jgi:diguanylate cyclase (GGDEF)-like protein/PAS domain S-box-containing protein
MAGEAPTSDHSWMGHVANVLVPSLLTGVAFLILSRLGLAGHLPVWMLLALLAVASVVGEFTGRFVHSDASARSLHFGIAMQSLSVSAVIYAVGWGPTLAIGYLFVVARALDLAGTRAWRISFLWAVVGISLGQVSIAIGLVPTYVRVPYVHGLAALDILGVGFVMSLLGAKTEQSECAFAERDRADSDVRSALSLLTATLDSTADGILVVDEAGRITQFNSRFTQMWRIPEEVLGHRDDSTALQFVLDQLVRPELFVAKVEELYAQPEAESDDTLRFKDGRVFERHSLPQRVDGAVVGRVWSFRDVTEHDRLVDELEHQAFHDSLTGLANRALLRDRLEHALARARRSAVTVAVLFCDLDGFKMINDTLGHDIGDLLLVEVARRFEQGLREGDTAARIGGDEFAIVLDDTNPGDAVDLAQRLLDAVREPFSVDGREILVRASIGVADSSSDAVDAEELICRADIAMYAAKTKGRDRFQSFEPAMQVELSARHLLHGDLRHAVLLDGALVLHYQPIIDLETGTIDSIEALVRWNHPTRGLVPPDEFIPMAEETGLIVDIGRYVLREACWQMMQWRSLPGTAHVSMSVNVSSHQLYDGQFVSDVETSLRDSGLPASGLILELTESSLLSDTSRVHQRLAALRSLGVRVAIDDFGTGYSSLAYLRSFPIDFLKIDRSFVNELEDASDDQGSSLVRSIISIGHDLDLVVIAEGIEHASQLDELRAAGCDFGQGYFFGRPIPPDEVPELLARHVSPRETTPAAIRSSS